MITATYHLVRPAGSSWLPGMHAVTPDELRGQVEHLGRHHRLLAPGELREALAGGAPPAGAALLTFDDGSAGQLEHALPVLLDLSVAAFFFIPTGVLSDGRLPAVEKQRVLQYAEGEYADFYAQFCAALARLAPEVPPAAYRPEPDALEAAASHYSEYAFYSPLERLFRKVRETVLTHEQFEAVISYMFAERYSEPEFAARYSMNWDGVRELQARGMEIGGHGHRHLVDTAVAPSAAADDARKALSVLEAGLGSRPWAYAYPYGISVPATVSAIAGAGVEAAFTCRPGLGMEGRLAIDRLDWTELPTNPEQPPGRWSRAELAEPGASAG